MWAVKCRSFHQAASLRAGKRAISENSLFRQQAFLGGEWVDAYDKQTYEVHNPATGVFLGNVPKMGQRETREAIEKAENASRKWRLTPSKERANVCRKWFNLMLENKEELAQILTAEQGKPLAEARQEIEYGASFLEIFAEEAKHIFGEVIPPPHQGTRILVLRQPVGVVAAITPWNFPSSMITRKVGAALAAGCPVILKPSELTPYSAFALCELANRAGVPRGVFSCLTGEAKAIGEEMCSNPIVRKLTFTGSTRVGKLLAAQCAATVKRVSLELGGNAPFIVFDDADIEKAVAGVMASKFRNNGQTCVTSNRIFVQSKIYAQFAQQLTVATQSLKVGDGTVEGITTGPLINQAAVDKIERLVRNAIEKGAKAIVGGARHQQEGLTSHFYQPTLLTDATKDMELFSEEAFGPICPLFKFETEEEVLKLANDTRAGLAAYCYTKDHSRQWRMGEGLDYGMVAMNQPVVSVPSAPFGGMKESGYGREGSHLGLNDYLEVKAFHMAV